MARPSKLVNVDIAVMTGKTGVVFDKTDQFIQDVGISYTEYIFYNNYPLLAPRHYKGKGQRLGSL